MKKLYWILAAIAVVMLLWLGWRWSSAPHVDPPSKTVWKKDAPTSIQNDPVKIFQRAFWATPTSEDKILHAERREWSGPDGVEKWQWFLVVEPSPALLKRLRDDNAFGLIPAPSAIDILNAPNWFQFKREEVSVLKSPQAKLQLIFSKDNRTLYATDSGLGFRPGAPEQIPKMQPSSSAPSSGRLPITPPPRPKAPTEE
jgi:hypothetical protein